MIKGLPRNCFVDDSIFQSELNRIFSTHWIAVATTDDFATAGFNETAFLTVQSGEHSIVLVRHADSANEAPVVAAFHNVCRHRGTRLLSESSGALKNQCITCPYHAWSYDCQGNLIGAPNMTDVDDFDRSDFPLQTVRCQVWAGIVFVNLGGKTASQSSQASLDREWEPLFSRMKNWQVDELAMHKTLQYDVKANWKLIFQNYSECYHCPTVHPDLNQQTPYKSATNDLVEGRILGGPMELADAFQTVSSDGKSVGPLLKGLTETQTRSIFYYTIFPNVFVSAHPDYVMIHQLAPQDVNNTLVKCHFLADPAATADSLGRAWQMWDNVNRQDWQVCELTQLGAQSPAFQPGPYSNLESMLAAFDRHYRLEMGGQPTI